MENEQYTLEAKHIRQKDGKFVDKSGKEYTMEQIEAMCRDYWSNSACRGYTIKAMESQGFTKEQIKGVMGELRWLFDEMSVKEAEDYYCKSEY